MRRSRDIAVHIVTDQSAPPAERRGVAPPSPMSLAGGAGAAALSVAAAVGAGLLLEHWLHLPESVDDFSRRGDLLRLAFWLVVGDRGGRALLFRLRLFFRRAAL